MGKIKILYVEDEPFLGRIVKESLESCDFDVTMVTDGKEALPQFKILGIWVRYLQTIPKHLLFQLQTTITKFCTIGTIAK